MRFARKGPVRALVVGAAIALSVGLATSVSAAAPARPQAAPARPQAAPAATNGPFFVVKIRNYYTDMVVDIIGPNKYFGTRLNQYPGYNTDSQLWELYPWRGGYQIKSWWSKLCMDTTGPSTANGAPVQQSTCYNSDSQVWLPQHIVGPFGDTTPDLVLRNLYSGKCLDVMDYNTSPNALLQQWSCVGDWNQQFHWQAIFQSDF